jgi:hypothetical protein
MKPYTEKSVLIRMPVELYKQISHAAVDRLITNQALIMEALRAHLNKGSTVE